MNHSFSFHIHIETSSVSRVSRVSCGGCDEATGDECELFDFDDMMSGATY